MRPSRPPVELRARVLLAAREAADRPAPGLLEALFHDRLLRRCATALAVLAIANALVPGGGMPSPAALPPAFTDDDRGIPADSGLTAAEQWDELAPILGDTPERSRG